VSEVLRGVGTLSTGTISKNIQRILFYENIGTEFSDLLIAQESLILKILSKSIW
jgi:hypothetical protein